VFVDMQPQQDGEVIQRGEKERERERLTLLYVPSYTDAHIM